MQLFEIRFYVNISGYREYKLDDSGGLFPEDMAYHFWEEDALFLSGTYAIHYGSSACILSYLTEVSPELDWRNNRIRIAVALRHRQELSHPLEVFDELHHRFQELAEASPDLSLLHSRIPILNEVVAKNLVLNPDQSIHGSNSGEKAVTAYKRKEELAALLAHPFRPEFENVAVLYILPQQEAAALWPNLKINFKAITEVKYEEMLVTPSGNTDTQEESLSELEVSPREILEERIEQNEEGKKPDLKKERKIGIYIGALLMSFAVCFFTGWHSQAVEYEGLKEDYAKLEKENESLKKQLQESSKKSVENVSVEKKALSEEEVEQPMASLGYREVLVKKLRGTAFTQADINKLKKMNPDADERRLIESCEACLKLLNAPMKDREMAREQIRKRSGFMFHVYCRLTIPIHKKAMDEIILKRYDTLYRTSKRIFSSIQDATDEYKKLLNGQ